MLYLDDETLAWAQTVQFNECAKSVKHIDSNGVERASGDSVVVIKDLDVKGAKLPVKCGSVVCGISLVYDNAEQIEGRVNGQRIVLLTKIVKKSN